MRWEPLADGRLAVQDFVTSFNCALRQKILLQGHLYIFTHNICFYCNIFGFVQKRVIPLRVRRKVNRTETGRQPVLLGCFSVHHCCRMWFASRRGSTMGYPTPLRLSMLTAQNSSLPS